ncbi:3-hydroxyisobutyrate dehydrogenase [Fusarium sp. NRRL 25303]|nr:3-hydroxyisobutyrate dehydrogenase [Fusarium sp. NRRL 25303]
MADITWGFVGLGNIGYPMAINLRDKMPNRYNLIIHDVNYDAMNRFAEQVNGMRDRNAVDIQYSFDLADNARQVAEKSTVLITCLPSTRIVQDVYNSILNHGTLPQLAEKRLFIDCSTIDPVSSQEIGDMLHKAGCGHFVDAPMSGGVVGARAGTLSFMFGSAENLEEQVKSALLLMGKSARRMGNQGTGVCSKLANNYILSINNIASAEALNMARQWGLDLRALSDLIKSSTGRCWPIDVNNPAPGVDESAPASNGYAPGGTVNIIKKDLELAMAGAKASGALLPLAEKAHEVYCAVEEAYSGKDLSVVYQWLQNQA